VRPPTLNARHHAIVDVSTAVETLMGRSGVAGAEDVGELRGRVGVELVHPT
jgi:hypothetical protein